VARYAVVRETDEIVVDRFRVHEEIRRHRQ
jgi:hypothetical protein